MTAPSRVLVIASMMIWIQTASATDCESIVGSPSLRPEAHELNVEATSMTVVSDEETQVALIQDSATRVHIVEVGAKQGSRLAAKVNSLAVKVWGASHVVSWIGYKFANIARAGGHHAWYTDSYTNSVMNFTAIGLAHSFLIMETKMESVQERLKLSYFVSLIAAIAGITTEISPFDAQDFSLQLLSSAAYPAVYWLSVKWMNRKNKDGDTSSMPFN